MRVNLPGALRLHAPNTGEARTLYHEIFEARAYDRHGVAVRDGDCVFDVGANAGFFAVYLALRCRGLRVYAFEPAPEVFRLLALNAREYLDGATTRLFACGLAAAPGTGVFCFTPSLTLATTCCADDVRRAARPDVPALEWARAMVADAERSRRLGAAAARLGQDALATPGVRGAAAALLRTVALAVDARRRQQARAFVAAMRTLSDVVRDEGVETIDLLKIDVEGAEWEVLRGIEDVHWPRIRQVVVEVHDVDGRVGRVRDLLASKGFATIVDREDWALHALLGIKTVFARRPSV